MTYTFLDFFNLIGSLGVFLFGMKMMSEALQRVAGDKLRYFLSVMTKNRVLGILTGILITSLVQSSSATTVMVVSFVNAGLLSLFQAITVIMGANTGTTITAWIISLFGFKISIAKFALPLIAVSIPLVFSSNNKRKSIGECLLGFAFLFMGLDMLKHNVPDLGSNPELLSFLTQYTGFGFGSVLLFLGVGTALTVVVQSSSASMAITLIMCGKGWIPFELAAAMVLGENIGTTITANLAAIPANVSAKRAALAHLVFNIFGVIWILVIFSPFMSMISKLIAHFGTDPQSITNFVAEIGPDTLKLINDPEAVLTPEQMQLKATFMDLQLSTSYGLSLFHTIFNIVNTFLLIWFVPFIAKVVTLALPKRQDDEEFRLNYISTGLLSTSELSILQADQEIDHYALRTQKMFAIVREFYAQSDLPLDKFEKTYARLEKYESVSDRMEIEIANYLTSVAEGRLSDSSKQNVHVMLRIISEIESIGDACYNLARILYKKRIDEIEYTEGMDKNIYHIFDVVDRAIQNMIDALKSSGNQKEVLFEEAKLLEQEINDIRGALKMNNATDLKSKTYSYPVGVSYIDLISECEKAGDYIINVVEQNNEMRH